jgi:ADP-ribose pyrophosphatase
MTRQQDPDDRVRIVERSTPFQGYFRIDRYRLRHRRFDGGWSDEIQREVFERGHAAAVLPYDPARDTVVLIEQFRIGAYAAGLEPWLIEIVAGIIEPGEAAAEVVRREAREEAGCEIGALEPVGSFIMSPGGASETLSLFCGRVESAGAGGLHGLAEEHEDIRAIVLSSDKAIARLAAGEIANASAAIALQWLALNRERLRATWC